MPSRHLTYKVPIGSEGLIGTSLLRPVVNQGAQWPEHRMLKTILLVLIVLLLISAADGGRWLISRWAKRQSLDRLAQAADRGGPTSFHYRRRG